MISLLAKKGLLLTKERKQIHPYALEVHNVAHAGNGECMLCLSACDTLVGWPWSAAPLF